MHYIQPDGIDIGERIHNKKLERKLVSSLNIWLIAVCHSALFLLFEMKRRRAFSNHTPSLSNEAYPFRDRVVVQMKTVMTHTSYFAMIASAPTDVWPSNVSVLPGW